MHTKLLLRLREILIVCVVVTVEKTKRENECKIGKMKKERTSGEPAEKRLKKKKKYNSENREAKSKENKIENK